MIDAVGAEIGRRVPHQRVHNQESEHPMVFPRLVIGAFAAASVASAASATIYTGTGGTIPDNNPAGFVSDIVVDDEFSIDDITINLNGLVHTWIGDLVVFVSYSGVDGSAGSSLFDRVGKTSPSTGFGDSSNLSGTYSFNDGGGDLWAAAAAASGTDDIVAPGVYFASGGLSPAKLSLNGLFAGLNAKGTWSLSIVDAAGGDLGTLESWSIDFVKSPIPAPAALAPFALAGLLGGGRGRGGVRRRR